MSESSPWITMDDSKMDEVLRAWKSKSLNSMPTEKYVIPTKPSSKEVLTQNRSSKKEDLLRVAEDPKTETLPEPKITKLQDTIFCVYLNTELMIFIFVAQEEKLIHKPKGTFKNLFLSFQEPIKFVCGNHSDYIYIGLENELHIAKLKRVVKKTEDGIEVTVIDDVERIEVKNLPKLKGVGFVKDFNYDSRSEILVAMTADKIMKCKFELILDNMDNSYKLVEEKKIVFEKSEHCEVFSNLKTIELISEDNSILYLFGTKEGIESEINEKYEGNAKKRKCEFLYLTKFILEKGSDEILAQMSMIDHVFEIGIFGKSKIYQEGPSVFLISLFEEIIVVKYHFEKYVVWDNISLAASKSNEKKGQLILADEIVMVYTENSDIFAHNIFFSFKDSKLKYPRIDNFKGNDNDEEILYDAVVLEYEQGSFMKVLFYFKELEVYTPNNKNPILSGDKNLGDHKEVQVLNVNILCIQQNDPVLKLGELFKNKKPPQEISEFVQRFSIAEIDRSKCEWSVSEKTEKDIENLLLDIKDNEYIQNELTKILKSEPHDLKFLSRIEKKQIERYKKMLASKILKNDQDFDPENLQKLYEETGRYFTKDEIEEIKLMIKWVMESIMFEKKLVYSKNFLEFMEYEFIEIGKLKAASLREEIKLLSCKGFEKRLKYFLNSFKYMILANFKDIFEFLIEDKNEEEVQNFFIESFPFILPSFKESSKVFENKKYRDRRTSFAPLPNEISLPHQDDACELWFDRFKDEIRKIETKESFHKEIENEIIEEIKKFNSSKSKEKLQSRKVSLKQCLKEESAKSEFSLILEEFINESWFKENKSKLHSIIDLDVNELQIQFEYLKRIGVFNILISFFYQKIAEGTYERIKVDKILNNFKTRALIPESFTGNVIARRQVYEKIESSKPFVKIPLLKEFLVYEETDLFDYLFKNHKEMLLREIKEIYDGVLKEFFKEKFQIYLNSDKIVLSEIIGFLDEFEGNSIDDIRNDVFSCIKKLLRVNDKENTSSLVNKLIDKEILKNQGESFEELIDEAKVTYGCYFHEFFSMFGINETYENLINETKETSYERCTVLKLFLERYCTDEYYNKPAGSKVSERPEDQWGQNSENLSNSEGSEEEEIIVSLEEDYGLFSVKVVINFEPLRFFSLILYIMEELRFKINKGLVFDKYVELLLEVGKYETLVYLIESFHSDVGGEGVDDSYLEQNEEEFRQKNWLLLKEFYNLEGEQLNEKVIENTLMWMRRQFKEAYEEMRKHTSSYENIYKERFMRISLVFEEVIDKLNLESIEIVRERAFLELLKNIQQVEPSLINEIIRERFEGSSSQILHNSDRMEEERSSLLNDLSGFMFMIKLLQSMPKEKFDQYDSNRIKMDIDLMKNVYENFKSTSRFAQNSGQKEDETGLIRFYMELVIKLIKNKQFLYCKHVVQRIISSEYYFKDVFFQFLSWINQEAQKPTTKEFKKFIQDFISVSSEVQMTKLFDSFIAMNEIDSFQIDKDAIEDLGASNRWAVIGIEKIRGDKKTKTIAGREPYKHRATEKIQTRSTFELDEKRSPEAFTLKIFEVLLEKNLHDEAYYFLVRNTLINVSIASINDLQNEKHLSQALMSIYLKCLESELCTDFYPTFYFYQNKHSMLLNEFERKDVIKDIVIAISKMKEKVSEIKLKFNENNNKFSFETAGKLISEALMTREAPTTSRTNLTSEKSEETPQEEKVEKNQMDEMKVKQRELEEKLKELNGAYYKFMKSINLDPEIKLNEDDLNKGKLRLTNMGKDFNEGPFPKNGSFDLIENNVRTSPRFEASGRFENHSGGFTPHDLSNRQIDDESDEERKLEIQIKKAKENPKFMEIEKKINDQLRETKILSEKYEDFESSRQRPAEVPSKITKSYIELKEKEKRDIDSIKESFKSSASQRVNDVLEELRLRKSKINDRSDVKSRFSVVDVDSSEPARSRQNSLETNPFNFTKTGNVQDLITPPDFKSEYEQSPIGTESNFNEINVSRKYEVNLHGVDGMTKNIYMPVTISKDETLGSKVSIKPQNSILIDDSKRKQSSQIYGSEFGSQKSMNIGHSKLKLMSFEELLRIFEEKDPQCKKYVEKIENVKNNLQVGLQIVKNIYSTLNNFDVFVQLLGYLFETNPKYKEILEEKAYKIAKQALGFEHKMNLKELFPIDFFTKVVKASQKEYNKVAYETIRPSLLKVLARPEVNVHGIGVIFRYGFGSDNTYFYQIYEDYIRVLLKEYENNSIDEDRLFLFAEKLRSLYGNIGHDDKEAKFERLIREVSNEQKRRIIVKEMLKIINRREEMLTGEREPELKNVLQRIY